MSDLNWLGDLLCRPDEPLHGSFGNSVSEQGLERLRRMRAAAEPLKDTVAAPDADLLQSDLRELLTILGMGDHARPHSPHEVFQEALGVLRRRLSFDWRKRERVAFLISDLCDEILEYDPTLGICGTGTMAFKAADKIADMTWIPQTPFIMDRRAQAAALADLPPSVAQEAGEFYQNAGGGKPIQKSEAMAAAWASVLRPYLIGLRDHSDTQARPEAR